MGTLSFTIRWTPGLHDVHRETLPDDLADVANLFLLHASTIAAEDRNRVRVRLPEDDGSHDHSSSSTPGGRKSGELSSSSSRRSSMSGLSDEEREHRISFDDGGNRVVKKTKKEKSGHNWCVFSQLSCLAFECTHALVSSLVFVGSRCVLNIGSLVYSWRRLIRT